MSAAIPSGFLTIFGQARGRTISEGGMTLGVCRLDTDSIGSASVTFLGVNANSEIRIYLPDTTEVAGIENCADDQLLSWGVYSAGNANNAVRIVIVHPDYKIKEFEYLSSLGNQSIPVQQERDKWYSNPV